MNRWRICGGLLASMGLVLLAGSASALTTYTDVLTANVSFTGIQEASSFGDPEPLFDQPVASGPSQITFNPPNFTAESVGGAGTGIDSTGSQLQLMFESAGGFYLETLVIEEFGDATLSAFPPPGDASTGVFMSMSGFVTVQEANFVDIPDVVIPFVGVFTPSDLILLPGGAGATIWEGTAIIDIAAAVPNATKAFLSFDNDLTAASVAGTSAKTQKKIAGGVVITVVPEPATAGLLALGLLGLAVQGRRLGIR